MNSYLADCGFVYVATGDRFVREAVESARSLRGAMPGAVIVLHSDLPAEAVIRLAGGEELFREVRPLKEARHGFFDKLAAFATPRFSKTVFLDTDTHVCRAMPELFDLLDRFDLAAVRDDWAHPKDDSPKCFDDFNTGVVAFRDNEATRRVFARWREIYAEQIRTGARVDHDQPAFREAVFGEPEAGVYVLPRRYNLRMVGPIILRHGGWPVVLHGRGYDFARLQAELSRPEPYRVVLLSGELLAKTRLIGGTAIMRNFFIPWARLLQGLVKILLRAKG